MSFTHTHTHTHRHTHTHTHTPLCSPLGTGLEENFRKLSSGGAGMPVNARNVGAQQPQCRGSLPH